jgi:chromosome segregation ATPase
VERLTDSRNEWRSGAKIIESGANAAQARAEAAEAENERLRGAVATHCRRAEAAESERDEAERKRAEIADEYVVLRAELDEAQRHWDKANTENERLRAFIEAAGRLSHTTLLRDRNNARSHGARMAQKASAAESESAGLRARLEGVERLVDEQWESLLRYPEGAQFSGFVGRIRAALAEPTTERGGHHPKCRLQIARGLWHCWPDCPTLTPAPGKEPSE